MRKLQRLINNCNKQIKSSTGTAEGYRESLCDLGKWVLTQYNCGNLKLEELENENDILRNSIKTLGEKAEKNGYWISKKSSFTDQIAVCHRKLSKIYELYIEGFVPSSIYIKDCTQIGIPLICADIIIQILIVCYHHDIDIVSEISKKVESFE